MFGTRCVKFLLSTHCVAWVLLRNPDCCKGRGCGCGCGNFSKANNFVMYALTISQFYTLVWHTMTFMKNVWNFKFGTFWPNFGQFHFLGYVFSLRRFQPNHSLFCSVNLTHCLEYEYNELIRFLKWPLKYWPTRTNF